MSLQEKVYLELFPFEFSLAHLRDTLKSQLQKGISLKDVILAVETDILAQMRIDASAAAQSQEESKYIPLRRSIEETFLWLRALIASRKELSGTQNLSEEEDAAVQKMQSELQKILTSLDPLLQTLIQKRGKRYEHVDQVLLEAIEHMESETSARMRTIVLEYEKMGEEKFLQIQSTFDQFFKNLRESAHQILPFLKPKIGEWNTLALTSGRGFLIDCIPHLSCSFLFSVKGDCRLIFENVGHLLGSGLDKLVFRSICLPEGKIEALIKPLYHEKALEDANPLKYTREQVQFQGMWLETEMLVKLRHKKGIIHLAERMVFEIENEKKLFLAEDYYWDGTLWDFLKYPIKYKIESAKLSSAKLREILSDLLEGLVEIHQLNIVHHDLKLDNILLDLKKEKGSAVIADFHLATYVSDVRRIKKIGFVPRWAPPEYAKIQVNADKPYEELLEEHLKITHGKLDVWSLGIIFYALITYELPFWLEKSIDENPPVDEKEIFELIASLQKGWLSPAAKASPYFPLLEKMLEPNPEERCSSAEALEIFNYLSLKD